MSRLAQLLGVAAAGLACVSSPDADDVPVTQPAPSRWRVQLSAVGQVGPYLDATISNERFSRRFFFPRSAGCTEVLQGGDEIQYRMTGPFGRLGSASGARCDPIGVGSLREWRDELPRRRSRFLLPREQAEFRPIHADGPLLLLRGRFPLALEIRWPEPMDSVAVTPADPACRALLSRQTTTMEFRPEGPDVFLLQTDQGYCPIIGLVLPLLLD